MDSVVEVIKDGEIIRMSESRALEEDLFILRKIIEPEKMNVETVPRVPKMQVSAPEAVKSYSFLEKWKAGKVGYRKNNVLKELKENFQWEILKNRRAKGVDRKQLADAIEISEDDLKIIEFGDLPKDDFVIINKIEDYLKISLRKKKEPEANLFNLQKAKEEEKKDNIEKFKEEKRKEIVGDDLEIIE